MITVKDALACDVLVAGGGPAGLMAAIAASKAGAKVILADTANPVRSGSGATGTDHFLCYIPEVHGENPAPYIAEMELSQIGGNNDMNLVRRYVAESFDRVKDWESYGIPMRPHGDWEFNGHAMPDHPRIWLKFAGRNEKPLLTKEAQKCGINILCRHPFTEVITDEEGTAIGGICVDLTQDEPALVPILAKSVVLATGGGSRLYTSNYSGYEFNTGGCPANVFAGRAAALRAGARLVNTDNFGRPAGCKYFNRGGKATWLGVYSDINGKPIGPFATKPSKEYGDMAGDIWRQMFTSQRAKGEPVFMNCTEATDEELEYMFWGLGNEGNVATLNHLEEEGFDWHTQMVEFAAKGQNMGGGIDIDIDAATTVKGLYAAGDETGNFKADLGGAAVFGHIAGSSAAEYASRAQHGSLENNPILNRCMQRYSQILDNPRDCSTPTWKEVNVAIEQTMTDYCGIDVQSDHLLSVGIEHLGRIKKKMADMHCDNSHTFMHCLEVEDILLMGQTAMTSLLTRKESRGNKNRVDYPFVNTLLNGKFVTIELKNGELVTGWRNKVK